MTRFFKVFYYGQLATVAGVCCWLLWRFAGNIENSWLQFLHRALAPSALIVCGGVFGISLLLRKARVRRIEKLCSLILLATLGAPVIRSTQTSYTHSTRRISAQIHPGTLTVLDLNALGKRELSENVLSEIRRYRPDVVALQEVNHYLAQAISTQLSGEYPCQILRPDEGTSGMGIVSRFPCSVITDSVEGSWVGSPIVAEISPDGRRPFVVATMHAIAPHMPVPENSSETIWRRLSNTVEAREQSVARLLQILTTHKDKPIILAGDLNATVRNNVYSLVREHGFKDSWLTLHDQTNGGTWPFPEIFGLDLLSWFLRIDFIFYSDLLTPIHGETVAAEMGSDHRGLLFVFKELSLET